MLLPQLFPIGLRNILPLKMINKVPTQDPAKVIDSKVVDHLGKRLK